MKRLYLMLSIATVLVFAGIQFGHAFGPVGSEFQVNTYTTGDQLYSSVAMDSDGDFVVTWASDGQDGSSYGVYAQRYDSSGNPVGSEFRVNTYTTSYQWEPCVAMDSDGDFVVTWHSYGQDGSGDGVYGQRYDSSGNPVGSEFQVNTYTTGAQASPSVAMDSDGDFVVTWHSWRQDDPSANGVYGQRYDSSGNPVGSEFRVNTYTAGDQSNSSVAMDSDGDFVVTWSSGYQDGSSYGVYAQRYDSSGNPVGSEFQVNTYTTNAQSYSSVAMDSDGDFVVTWTDWSRGDVYAQGYDSSGNPVGSEFRVNTYTTGDQLYSSVAMDSDGDFVVTWTDWSRGDVYAQGYDSSGNPVGSEFQVNTYTTSYQWEPCVAMDSDGDFVVTWRSDGQDGSGYGVYGQIYAVTTVVSIDIKPGSYPNSINLGSNGVIPVAILGSEDFDVATIDPLTVRLEGAGVRLNGKSGNAGSIQDVNSDGYPDLVVHIIDFTLTTGATTANLTANLTSGTPIQGSDSISIVPPQ